MGQVISVKQHNSRTATSELSGVGCNLQQRNSNQDLASTPLHICITKFRPSNYFQVFF